MATLVGLGSKKKRISEKDNKEMTRLKAEVAKLEEKVEDAEKAKVVLVSENEDLKAEIAKLKSKS